MRLILRPAVDGDSQAVEGILKPWTDHDPALAEVVRNTFHGESPPAIQCSVLEAERVVRCVALWQRENAGEVRLAALGTAPGAGDLGLDERFLREQILDWAELKVPKVTIKLPETLAPELIGCLKRCGFMLEGISTAYSASGSTFVRLSKHFLYRSVPHSQLMSFLKEFLLSLGYEVRTEGEGLGYRIRSEYRLPFIFSSWHRILRSGPDIIVHPPARVLELHELETLFYPLNIRSRNERPLLLTMEKKRAAQLVDFPTEQSHQDWLFDRGLHASRRALGPGNLTYSFPTGVNSIRKGLPLVFYVNRMGAVGSARVADWYLDEPKNLYNTLDEMGFFDPQDVREHAASSGPHAGKVLVIRFHWYRPLRRVVSLEEIRGVDATFNPQRSRSVSPSIFQSMLAAGDRTKP